MSLDPTLPVRVLPIAESVEADALFASGAADAFLAMTYIGAKKRMTGAVPDLRLHSISTWRGFFQVAAEGVSSFADLRGKTVIVSGPVGSGKNGGGDIIFQAAARRQGIDPDRDLKVEYMSAALGIERVAAGLAAGITLPSPASTGLEMRARMAQQLATGNGGGPSRPVLKSAIDFQRVFPGFASFPDAQLPLGGLHVAERALTQRNKRAMIDRVADAYARASTLLMTDPARHAGVTSALFKSQFASVGAGAPPSLVLQRGLTGGDMVYRSDVPLGAVRADLTAWLKELLGRPVDAGFTAAI
jgi:hypothetical protein